MDNETAFRVTEQLMHGPSKGTPFWDLGLTIDEASTLVKQGWAHWRNPRSPRRLMWSGRTPPKPPKPPEPVQPVLL